MFENREASVFCGYWNELLFFVVDEDENMYMPPNSVVPRALLLTKRREMGMFTDV